MADSKLRIVIDASADGAKSELGTLRGDLKATGAATSDLASTQKKAAFSFTELNSAISIGKQALGLMQQAYTAVIDPTIKYADEVRSLSREIGASAEESSKLIQAADDVFISTETLTAGLQSAIRKGFQPTIAGLGQMSDKYLSIQDPIERTKFLMDTFGRSGADLGALMEKGSAGIDKMGAAAERAGQVLSGDDLKATLAYKEAIDSLQDSLQGLTIALSRDAIPALTDVASKFGDALDVQARYNDVVESGALTQEQKTQIQLADMLGLRTWGLEALTAAEAQAKINDYLKTGTNAYSYMIPVVENVTALTVALTGAYDSQIGIAERLTATESDLNSATAIGASLTGELTGAMILQSAAAGESSIAQLAIARAMGLVNENTLDSIGKVQALKASYDAGTITLANYVYQLGLIKNGLDGLTDKDININFHVNGWVDPAAGDAGINNWVAPPMPGGGSSGGIPQPPPVPPGGPGMPSQGGMSTPGGVTIINNNSIADGLAASLFMEQQRQQTIRAAEGLM